MIKFNVYLHVEQLDKLRKIGRVSLGKPDVSSLIRDAIDDFIVTQSAKNLAIKTALESQSKPRLVKAASLGPAIAGSQNTAGQTEP